MNQDTPSIELGLYEHYKGKQYTVIGLAKHSETLEDMVVYKAMYQPEGSNLWVRPLSLFKENVVVQNQTIPRFKKL